ncbi:MAG: 1-aminocyclopropane-1-carboxylate deaminase/D-cysteine desulfhydrase [Gemmatimonadaceae bacterium]
MGTFPTPVQRLSLPGLSRPLWIKRDDLSAAHLGGNKVRSLEFLLGGLRRGDLVLTAGGKGSTHVLATAAHARALGIRSRAVLWRHDMHPIATAVEERSCVECERVDTTRGPVSGIARALMTRIQLSGNARVRWIPPGGSSALGVLGHVNAALELADQVARGEMPAPARVFVPLGTGGTCAGLLLGFQIAGLETVVVGVRVVPRIAGNERRVLRLVRSASRLIERYTGERIPGFRSGSLQVVHSYYGGAYGRPHRLASGAAAALLSAHGVRLDDTYSAKAFAAAFDTARMTSEEKTVILFWHTFDARWLGDSASQL